MRMASMILIAMGYNADQIHKENFVVPEKKGLTESFPVMDKEDKLINVKWKGSNYSFKSHYSESILDAALRQRIFLPYSCRGGVCSACVARCTMGEVWMSINDVLTEKDQQKGSVLTCTGYCVSQEVNLELS
jgi:ring-1,2-phenylacetyl-CoA epoxidase subunit PaaE